MANSTYKVLEVRCVIGERDTAIYVLCGPASDGLLGVEGWHKKVVSADVPAINYLRDAILSQEYLGNGNGWTAEAPN